MHSGYKPPNDQFELSALGHRDFPQIVTGVLHGVMTQHIIMEKRLEVEQWADSRDLTPNSFNSARWKKGYNPYLTFVSENIANMCKTSIMDPIPHTTHTHTHTQICVSAHPVILPQPIPLRQHFNFMKADCNVYSAELDKLIEYVGPIRANYL